MAQFKVVGPSILIMRGEAAIREAADLIAHLPHCALKSPPRRTGRAGPGLYRVTQLAKFA
jgi:hypothetical protein